MASFCSQVDENSVRCLSTCLPNFTVSHKPLEQFRLYPFVRKGWIT